jgi:hypothetical protein
MRPVDTKVLQRLGLKQENVIEQAVEEIGLLN